MNNYFLFISLFSLLITSCTCSKQNDPEEFDLQKRSYYMGVSLAQGIDPKAGYDEDEILRGFKAGLNGDEDIPTREQLQKFFIEEQEKKYRKENAEMFNRERSSKEFIEDLARKEQYNLAGTGVFYKISKEGAGEPPLATDKIVVRSKGTLPDGTVFEDTENKTQTMPVLDTPSGWRVLISQFKKGAKIKMALSPQQAYGVRGRDKVPPMSAVIFELEVVDIVRSKEKRMRL